MIERTNPSETALALAAAPPDEVGPMTPTTSVVLLALGLTQGWFTLYWRVTPPGPAKYDWIGLYANDWDPDSGEIKGNNWQWATEGTVSGEEMLYQTSTPVRAAAYEARYLVWNATTKAYESILRTPVFDGRVCAS